MKIWMTDENKFREFSFDKDSLKIRINFAGGLSNYKISNNPDPVKG